MDQPSTSSLRHRRLSLKSPWMLSILAVSLVLIPASLYAIFVRSMEWQLRNDTICLLLELSTDPPPSPLGAPARRSYSLPLKWVCYSVALILAAALLVAWRYRKSSRGNDVQLAGAETGLRKFRVRISLRNFLVVVLILGIVLPATYQYVRRVQQRRVLLNVNSVYFANPFRWRPEYGTITRKLQAVTFWEAMWRGNNRIGPVHAFQLVAPAYATQNYHVIDIDTTGCDGKNHLVIRVTLGNGVSGGSFDLFPGDVSVPDSPTAQETLRTTSSLASMYDVQAGTSAALVYPINVGETYKLGATGNWGIGGAGATNTVKIEIYAEDF